jgi:hypothetical protein
MLFGGGVGGELRLRTSRAGSSPGTAISAVPPKRSSNLLSPRR